MHARTLVTSLIASVFLAVAPAEADFKDVLAARLSANSEFLVVNLPPRPSAWPGAIFTFDMRVPIRRGDPKDSALVRGDQTSIEATDGFELAAGAKAKVATWFGFAASAQGAAEVTMTFPDARVVDMEYGELVRRASNSTEAQESAKRGQMPLIVVKAYEGTPTVTLIKKAGASAEAWAKLQKGPVDLNIQTLASSSDKVVYRAKEAVIFAFETMQVEFDIRDLSKGKITVKLASLPSQLFALRENLYSPFDLKQAAAERNPGSILDRLLRDDLL